MRITDIPIRTKFHSEDGSLLLLDFDRAVDSTTTREEFLAISADLQWNADRSTADTFYIPCPIALWDEQFFLTIVFRRHTFPFCTGWSLTLLSAGERDLYESVDNVQEFTQLARLLTAEFGRRPELIREIRAAIWPFEWGSVSVNAIVQNSSPYQINVAWAR